MWDLYDLYPNWIHTVCAEGLPMIVPDVKKMAGDHIQRGIKIKFSVESYCTRARQAAWQAEPNKHKNP